MNSIKHLYISGIDPVNIISLIYSKNCVNIKRKSPQLFRLHRQRLMSNQLRRKQTRTGECLYSILTCKSPLSKQEIESACLVADSAQVELKWLIHRIRSTCTHHCASSFLYAMYRTKIDQSECLVYLLLYWHTSCYILRGYWYHYYSRRESLKKRFPNKSHRTWRGTFSIGGVLTRPRGNSMYFTTEVFLIVS